MAKHPSGFFHGICNHVWRTRKMMAPVYWHGCVGEHAVQNVTVCEKCGLTSPMKRYLEEMSPKARNGDA